jgi:hypothetical protein
MHTMGRTVTVTHTASNECLSAEDCPNMTGLPTHTCSAHPQNFQKTNHCSATSPTPCCHRLVLTPITKQQPIRQSAELAGTSGFIGCALGRGKGSRRHRRGGQGRREGALKAQCWMLTPARLHKQSHSGQCMDKSWLNSLSLSAVFVELLNKAWFLK